MKHLAIIEDEADLRELLTYMASDVSTIERAMRLIFIAKNLERIGDLAMNLAEDVVYFITGNDVKHPKLGGEER